MIVLLDSQAPKLKGKVSAHLSSFQPGDCREQGFQKDLAASALMSSAEVIRDALTTSDTAHPTAAMQEDKAQPLSQDQSQGEQLSKNAQKKLLKRQRYPAKRATGKQADLM